MPPAVAALPLLAALLPALLMSPPPAAAWSGYWSYDLCHEDRKPAHDNDTFCRQGKDRIRIDVPAAGFPDITMCPSDPWGERDVRITPDGRALSFRSRDFMEVRLSLGQDGGHFHGTFRTPDGHSGRVWGRRLAGCG